MLVLLFGVTGLALVLWVYRVYKRYDRTDKKIENRVNYETWDLTVPEEELLRFAEVGVRNQDFDLYTAYQRMIALMHSSEFQQMEYRSVPGDPSYRGKELRQLLKEILCDTIDSTRELSDLEGFVQRVNGQNNLIQVCNYLRILSESNLLDELVRDVNVDEFRQVKGVFEHFQATIEVNDPGATKQADALKANKKRKLADDLTA